MKVSFISLIEVSPLYKRLKIIAVITTVMMIFVQIGGALVTKTESGEGCGTSWPLCHGQLIPSEWPIDTIIEIAHRGVSGIAIILVLIFCYMAWKQMSHKKETRFLIYMSIGFILVQALIGAAAVVWGQNDFALAAHFGISLISFSSVFLLTLLVFEIDQKFDARRLRIHSFLRNQIFYVTIYIYFVIYTGALVRHTGSELACTVWPHCQPGRIIPINFFEWVQMGHRAFAGILIIWLIFIIIHVFRHYSQYRVLVYGWGAIGVMILLQALTGALMIFTQVNLIIALLHALFITLTFALLCYYIMLITRAK